MFLVAFVLHAAVLLLLKVIFSFLILSCSIISFLCLRWILSFLLNPVPSENKEEK